MVTQRIHAGTGHCCRAAIPAGLAACVGFAFLDSAACGTAAPPPEVDTTLAAFTKDGDIEVQVDQEGHVTGTPAPCRRYTSSSGRAARACMRT